MLALCVCACVCVCVCVREREREFKHTQIWRQHRACQKKVFFFQIAQRQTLPVQLPFLVFRFPEIIIDAVIHLKYSLKCYQSDIWKLNLTIIGKNINIYVYFLEYKYLLTYTYAKSIILETRTKTEKNGLFCFVLSLGTNYFASYLRLPTINAAENSQTGRDKSFDDLGIKLLDILFLAADIEPVRSMYQNQVVGKDSAIRRIYTWSTQAELLNSQHIS